jgi:hypothetical protein
MIGSPRQTSVEDSDALPLRSVAIVGGTGKLGAALARRLARAGVSVSIGSRDAGRARSTAAQLSASTGRNVGSGTNVDVASGADMVILTVPYDCHLQALGEIRTVVAGKIVLDTSVPLVPPKVTRVQLPPEGCAAVAAQRFLGSNTTVVSAFHHVAAHKLAADGPIDCDVLVFGDQKQARETVAKIVAACGLRALHGGVLGNSAAAEALTSVLIFLNQTYSIDGAGIRITGTLNTEPRECKTAS